MANGIDAIYDPSDVRRMLLQFREDRLERQRKKTKKTKDITTVGTKAYEAWGREQGMVTKELLDTGDYVRKPKSNWITDLFTPSGGRVEPTKEALTRVSSQSAYEAGLDPDFTKFTDIRGPKTILESVGQTISKATESGTKVASEVAKKTEKATGSTLGKVGAGIGAGLSAYDLATNWKKKSDVDKVLGTASTALYAGSIFNPALGIYALGTSILDAFWD